MSRYPSGASIKDVMRAQISEITAILKAADMDEDDMKIVLGTIKENCFQWATSNALACALEDYIVNEMHVDKDELYNTLLGRSTVEKVFKETIADFDEDEDEFEGISDDDFDGIPDEEFDELYAAIHDEVDAEEAMDDWDLGGAADE